MKNKSWLIYGSGFGGAIGALLLYLNSLLAGKGELSLDLPPGFMTATALGMLGGIVGGLIGSLISGVMAKEDIAINIGSSMGIGVINGFIFGAIMGVILGFIHLENPDILTPTVVGLAAAGLFFLAIIVSYLKKK